jgi:hypothetical protein
VRSWSSLIFVFAAFLLIAASNGPGVLAGTTTSSNWSGYAFDAPSGTTVSSVQGSWTVPAVNPSIMASGAAYAGFWVGIDGYTSDTVEQIGTDSDVNNGVASYYAWYEMYPNYSYEIPMTILPGDSITASVEYLSSSREYQLSITDSSRPGESFSQDFSRTPGTHPQRSSAEWVAEAPSSGATGDVLGLSQFGTVNFSGASATLNNGTSGPISSFPYDSIAMSTTATGLGTSPSPLDPTGSSFTVATAFPGDVNSDGKVDISDLTIVLANFGKTTGMWWGTGDLNGDGTVNLSDLTIVLANYGNTLGASAVGASAVPEPSIVALLAGAVGLLAVAYARSRDWGIRNSE